MFVLYCIFQSALDCSTKLLNLDKNLESKSILPLPFNVLHSLQSQILTTNVERNFILPCCKWFLYFTRSKLLPFPPSTAIFCSADFRPLSLCPSLSLSLSPVILLRTKKAVSVELISSRMQNSNLRLSCTKNHSSQKRNAIIIYIYKPALAGS